MTFAGSLTSLITFSIRCQTLSLHTAIRCAGGASRPVASRSSVAAARARLLSIFGGPTVLVASCCLEWIFKAIATRVDQTVPEGGIWHQELLKQMIAELSSVRPPVLSDEAWKKLDRYRGFRHVVRNVHAFELDPE